MDFITRYYGEQERYSKNSTIFPKKTIFFSIAFLKMNPSRFKKVLPVQLFFLPLSLFKHQVTFRLLFSAKILCVL